MDQQKSRELVIDACVLRAAGGEQAQHPTSKRCRDFLFTVLNVCHRVAVSPPIYKEWKEHMSKSSRGWLTHMFGKKKVRFVPVEVTTHLPVRMVRLASNPDVSDIVRKDMPLVACALQTDNRIVSIDEQVRRLLNGFALNRKELRKVAWVNPVMDHEKPIEWLEEGAPLDRSRLLGADAAAGGNK